MIEKCYKSFWTLLISILIFRNGNYIELSVFEQTNFSENRTTDQSTHTHTTIHKYILRSQQMLFFSVTTNGYFYSH